MVWQLWRYAIATTSTHNVYFLSLSRPPSLSLSPSLSLPLSPSLYRSFPGSFRCNRVGSGAFPKSLRSAPSPLMDPQLMMSFPLCPQAGGRQCYTVHAGLTVWLYLVLLSAANQVSCSHCKPHIHCLSPVYFASENIARRQNESGSRTIVNTHTIFTHAGCYYNELHCTVATVDRYLLCSHPQHSG